MKKIISILFYILISIAFIFSFYLYYIADPSSNKHIFSDIKDVSSKINETSATSDSSSKSHISSDVSDASSESQISHDNVDPSLKILEDKYKLSLTQHLRAKEYEEALKDFSVLADLNVELPSSFVFFKGEAFYQLKRFEESLTTLSIYINRTGKKGKFYNKAQKLILGNETAINNKDGAKSKRIKGQKCINAKGKISIVFNRQCPPSYKAVRKYYECVNEENDRKTVDVLLGKQCPSGYKDGVKGKKIRIRCEPEKKGGVVYMLDSRSECPPSYKAVGKYYECVNEENVRKSKYVLLGKQCPSGYKVAK